MSSSRELSHTAGSALDTSGRVECAASFQPLGWAIWPDLDAFTQGYVRALLRDFHAETGSTPITDMAFSDLAPETLAAILKDCSAADHLRPGVSTAGDSKAGGHFWRVRQTGELPNFPPLTVCLGDDGKLRTRPVTGPLEGRTGQLREDQ